MIGIVAGYRRGATDRVAGIVTDALLSIPAIVLAIVMVTKLSMFKEDQRWLDWLDRRWQITLTLGIVAIAPLARIVRAQTLSLREREFVLVRAQHRRPHRPHPRARDPPQPRADDADGCLHRPRAS